MMARLSALFAAVATLVVAPVQAASFASASLSDFKITLFDLNPADGIKPGITFREPYLGDHALVFALGDDTQLREVVGTGPFDLRARASVSPAVSAARAVVAGTGPTNVTSLGASGSALGAPVSQYGASASSPSLSDFTVTGNTRVSLSALGRAEATVTIGQDVFGNTEDATAGVELHVQSQEEVVFHDDFFAFAGFFPGSDSRTRFMTGSFANVTGSDMVFSLGRAAFAQGLSFVVPEPETYALMVAGLGLLSFMLRRRGARGLQSRV